MEIVEEIEKNIDEIRQFQKSVESPEWRQIRIWRVEGGGKTKGKTDRLYRRGYKEVWPSIRRLQIDKCTNIYENPWRIFNV